MIHLYMDKAHHHITGPSVTLNQFLLSFRYSIVSHLIEMILCDLSVLSFSLLSQHRTFAGACLP